MSKIETLCVQGGYTPGNGEPRQIPIVQSTTFRYETSQDMAKLFDLEADYGQTHDLVGEDAAAEQRMVELLKRGLTEHAAPAEQFERLGLA